MSITRFGFFIILCIVSGIWAAFALSAQYTRLKNQDLIFSVRSGGASIKHSVLDDAIANYEHAIDFIPCNVALYKDLALFSTYGADLAMDTPYTDQSDKYLGKTLSVLSSLLSCTPMDGKAWLDYATLNVYREGFTSRSLKAYKMSQRVTPGESWLAEKRLLFALKFKPLLDAEARAVALKDIVTLEHAHPNHMNTVLEVAELKSKEELRDLFAPSIKY